MKTLSVCFAGCVLFLTAARATAQAPATTPPIDCTQLSVDSATKTVTFQLVAAQTGLMSGLNFNGFNNGKLTLTVPQNWNVVIQFSNKDANLPHSAEIVDTTKPMPAGPVDPSFARAATSKLMEGMPNGAGETFRFVADKPGSFMIFCAVPGHGLAGMWLRLNVSATEKRPTLTATS
jgi:sulfocyanin